MCLIFFDCVKFLINLVTASITTVIGLYILLNVFAICFNLIAGTFFGVEEEDGGEEDNE